MRKIKPKIKVIIFDLDDTLFDCSGLLGDQAKMRAAEAMVAAGIGSTVDELFKKQTEIFEKFGSHADIFKMICDEYDAHPTVAEKAFSAYNSDEVGQISVYPGTVQMLKKLRKDYKVALITNGLKSRQDRKIDLLGIRELFDMITVVDAETGISKMQAFSYCLRHFDCSGSEAVSVGDRLISEIKIGNIMGMFTIRLLKGKHRKAVPTNDAEVPDYEIEKVSDIPDIIGKIEKTLFQTDLRIVALGGGTGLPNVLKGFRGTTRNLSAIVTVTDAGRSSGQLRHDFKIPPPGDIRNCIVALSRSEKLLQDLFMFRFTNGCLSGHNFGNLFITAMTKITGSFEKAIRETSRILAIDGEVLPSSLEDVHVCAKDENGKTYKTDIKIYKREDQTRIEELFLEPKKPKAFRESVRAILNADVVLIGPGSLFTSILPNILVPGIRDALRKTKAKKIYVCNMIWQKGQTIGFSAKDHVDFIEKYLGKGVIDYIILNNKRPSKNILDRYWEKDKCKLVENDLQEDPRLIERDLLLENKDNRNRKGKHDLDLVRHDPKKIVKAVLDLV